MSYLCTNFLCILFALYCVVLFSALVMLMIIPNLEIGYVQFSVSGFFLFQAVLSGPDECRGIGRRHQGQRSRGDTEHAQTSLGPCNPGLPLYHLFPVKLITSVYFLPIIYITIS